MEQLTSLSDVFSKLSKDTINRIRMVCEKYNTDPNVYMQRVVDQIIKEYHGSVEGSYRKINQFVDLLRGFQNKDFDAMIGVSSLKGFGKTTASVQIAKRYLKKFSGEEFSFEKNMAYDNNDVYDKCKSMKKYGCLVCDEAVDFAMAEDWAKIESKKLKRVFTKIRTKHLIIFFNIPDFWWTDSKYRETLITLRLHMIIRGYTVFYTPDLRDGITDRWHRKELIDGVKPYSYFTNLKDILPSYRNHPCYQDDFAIPKMPIADENRYLKVRDTHIFSQAPTTYENRDYFLASMYNLHQLNPNWTFKKLALLTKNPKTGKQTIDPTNLSRWVKKYAQRVGIRDKE